MTKPLLSLLLTSSILFADTATAPTMTQNIDLGFANTSGNTKTLNINAKYALSHSIENAAYEPFKYNFQATGYITKDSGTKTAEEYTALLNGEQELLNKWLSYITLGWLRNKFSNYDNKFSLGVGIGKILLDDKKQKLVVKIGTAYNIEQFSNNQADNKFGSLNEYIEYTNKLNAFSDLYLKLGAMENFEDMGTDYEATALLGINFALNEAVHLSIEEELKYDNLPATGFKKTDTKSIIRLGYKF